mmetsp:Transcript_4110/g.8618  ORF Transcript_4110/g.8618 Transcript_4110/m.8618 type:complete len:274 (-) Transcript_4110:190-1011(-)
MDGALESDLRALLAHAVGPPSMKLERRQLRVEDVARLRAGVLAARARAQAHRRAARLDEACAPLVWRDEHICEGLERAHHEPLAREVRPLEGRRDAALQRAELAAHLLRAKDGRRRHRRIDSSEEVVDVRPELRVVARFRLAQKHCPLVLPFCLIAIYKHMRLHRHLEEALLLLDLRFTLTAQVGLQSGEERLLLAHVRAWHHRASVPLGFRRLPLGDVCGCGRRRRAIVRTASEQAAEHTPGLARLARLGVTAGGLRRRQRDGLDAQPPPQF